MNARHEVVLQDLMCGDRSEHDVDVQRLLRADPDFARSYADLRAAQVGLSALAGDDGATDADVASLVAAGDRAALAAALRPPRRPMAWRAVAMAAAILIAVGVAFGLAVDGARSRPADGRLGGASGAGLAASVDGNRWTLRVLETLPPGARYDLRLVLADGAAFAAAADTEQWTFPDEWNRAIERASASTLDVSWDDGTGLIVRRSLRLR